jgi:SAM-dependent methyltransferase
MRGFLVPVNMFSNHLVPLLTLITINDCPPLQFHSLTHTSQALQPHISTALGIDISPSMVSRYNTLFPSTSAHALEADLLSSPPRLPSSPIPSDFDIAAVGLGFHHFHSPADALVALSARVRRGGTVVIVDFAPFPAVGHGHHGHAHQAHSEHGQAKDETNDEKREEDTSNAFPAQTTQTIKTHGFNEEDMANLFGSAGLELAGYRSLPQEIEMFVGPEQRRVTRTVFVAVGIKK